MRRLALILLLLVGTLNAKTIYVSKAGSNTNPYDTWAKAATTVAAALAIDAAGDTVLFGAGVYLNSQIVPPTGATRPDMTYYLDSAYADIASDKYGTWSGMAQINGADTIPKSAWSVYSGSIYRASWTGSGCDNEDGAGGQAYVASQDGVLLSSVFSVDEARTGSPYFEVGGVGEILEAGDWYHDLATNYVYVWCWGSVNPNTVEIQVACKSPVKFSNTAYDNAYFGGLDIRMGKRGAVLFLEGADSNVFRHCKLSRTSYCRACNPAVIMGNKHEAGGEVRDSSGAWDATYSRFNVFAACSIGVAVGTHGRNGGEAIAHAGSGFIGYDMTETSFDTCTFYDLLGDGIEVKNSYASGSNRIFERVWVRGSRFQNMGGRGVNLYTSAYSCSVYGSIFINCDDAGVLIGDAGSTATKDGGGHIVYNNTFYQCNSGLEILSPYSDLSSGDFKYNIVYDVVAGPYGGNHHADVRRDVTGLTVTIDSNQYYEPSGAASFTWGSTTSRDFAYWNGTAGKDTHGLESNPTMNTTTFETTSAGTMNVTYGGRTWTVYGAIQPEDEPIAISDTCIQITGKTSLAESDTCYCIVDSLLYTFEQRDTLIHTNGMDNIRIWGFNSGGGRGIIGYSLSDTGSNSWVTDSAKGSVAIHVSGSDNVLIKNLAVVPRTIDDSVRSFVAVNALTVVGIDMDNDSIIAGGFSSRAYQQSTTGGNRSFNQLLQNSYFGTESKGYHRRDQLYGATIRLTTSILQSDRYGGSYNYAYKIRNCRVHTIHTGIGSAGFTVDTTPSPDDTIYPLIYIDTTTVTVDARNDLFVTYNDSDVNNSAGDPYGIAVDGVDRGSRILGNTISSMGATYYGGDGLLLQHIDATVDSPFVVAYNVLNLQHGAHPRIAEGRQAVVGTYIRNYSSGYYVSGLWYHHNRGYLVVDSDDTSTYRGKLYEGVRMGYDYGSRNNIIENNHFSVVASDSATRTTLDSLQGSGLSFVQRDSLYTGREYTGRGTIARYNYWRVPKTPIWFGDTRLGYGANNCKILGDTVNTIYNGDSTFVRFHQSGTYFDHHWGNTITNVVLQGYANYADIVKGTIALADSSTIAYPTENRHKQGKQLELVQTINLLITDDEAAPVSDATVWAVNDYGNRIDFANSDGSGLTDDALRWRFAGYDILSDGFTVEDSTAYNDYTIWAKSGIDSGSVTITMGAGLGVTDTIALVSGTPTVAGPATIIRGITLRGVNIK